MELQSSNFINGQHIDTFEEVICDTPLINFHNRHSESNSIKLKSSHKKSSEWQNDNICNTFDSIHHQPLSTSNNLDFCNSSVLSFDAYGNLTSDENDAKTSFKHEVPSLAEFDFIISSFEGKFGGTEKSSKISPSNSKQKRGRKQKSTGDNDKSLSTSDINFQQVFKEEFDTSCSLVSRYGRTRKQRKSEDGFVFGTINFNELRKVNSSKKRNSLPECENYVKKDKSNSLFDESKSISSSSLSNSGYFSEDDFLPISNSKKSKKVKKYDADFPFTIESRYRGTASKKSQVNGEAESNKSKIRYRSLRENKERKESFKNSSCENFAGVNKIKPENGTNVSEIKLENSRRSKVKGQIMKNDSTSENKFKSDSDCVKPVEADSSSNDITVVFDSLNDKANKSEIGTIQEDINIIKNSLGLSVPSGRFSPLKELPSIILEESHNHDPPTNLSKVKNKPLAEPSNIKAEQFSPEVLEDKSSGFIPKIVKVESINCEIFHEFTTTKFGRQVRKPIFIDLTHEKKSSSVKNKSLQDNSNVASHSLDHSSTLRTEIKSESCTYFIGDIVWVLIKGNPLWPGLVKCPNDQEDYTKFVKACGPLSRKMVRHYHVQFYYDNCNTIWVPATRIFHYEGLNKLKTYVDRIKGENLKKNLAQNYATRSLVKSYMKTLAFMQKDRSCKKASQWFKALEEADRAQKLKIAQRLKMFTIPIEEDHSKRKIEEYHSKRKIEEDHSKREIEEDHSKRKRPASSQDRLMNKAKKQKRETSTSDECKLDLISFQSSKSGDEFSGFDDDDSCNSILNTIKMKKDKLERHLNVGDFEVYLQKHLATSIRELHISDERARKLLTKRWSKLTPLQKSRYKSSSDQSSVTSSCTTDQSNSDDLLSTTTSSKYKKKLHHDGVDIAKGTFHIPKNEKICFICENVTNSNGSDMVKCRGICGGCFHLGCVGLSRTPKTDFKCTSCISNIHKCFICKSSEGSIIKCSVSYCGKFYHSHCINSWPQVSRLRLTEKLVCPRHVCHMCAANADDMNDPVAKTPPFTRCLRCPTTYHIGENCIAAGSEEITLSYHICVKHMVVPKNNSHHFNVNWCFCCSKGGSLLLCDQCPAAFHAECLNITAPEGSFVCEDCETGKFPVYGDIVWVKLGAYRWWPGEVLHPRHIPDNIENLSHTQGMFCVHFFGSDDYYWVSRGRAFHYQEGDQGSKYSSSKFLQQKFQRALEEALVAYKKQKEKRELNEKSLSLKGSLKPAPYVKIDTNKPVGNVRLGRLDTSTVTKCDCDPYSENPCRSDDKCINRMLMVECIREVCPAKERCCNQRFQKRQYPNLFPFKTSGRGWGLKTKDFIKKGEFVIEYVGELIDDAEFRRRIVKMHEYNEENYYFLTVEPDRLIDAGPKGNLARFMNHSCQPNCETQKWTVGADTRVGLFALEDIVEGSEVTFNYNLLCVGTDKKKCNCQAANCSGFIGAKVQKTESTSNKKTKIENGTRKRKTKKRKSGKDWENECFRCFGTGSLLLCDAVTCPKGYHLECLELSELPRGKWLCPWHHCDDCGARSISKCIMCPSSYCKAHVVDKFHSEPGLSKVCLDHDAEDIQTLRGQKEVEFQNPTAAEKSLQNSNEEQKEESPPSTVLPLNCFDGPLIHHRKKQKSNESSNSNSNSPSMYKNEKSSNGKQKTMKNADISKNKATAKSDDEFTVLGISKLLKKKVGNTTFAASSKSRENYSKKKRKGEVGSCKIKFGKHLKTKIGRNPKFAKDQKIKKRCNNGVKKIKPYGKKDKFYKIPPKSKGKSSASIKATAHCNGKNKSTAKNKSAPSNIKNNSNFSKAKIGNAKNKKIRPTETDSSKVINSVKEVNKDLNKTHKKSQEDSANFSSRSDRPQEALTPSHKRSTRSSLKIISGVSDFVIGKDTSGQQVVEVDVSKTSSLTPDMKYLDRQVLSEKASTFSGSNELCQTGTIVESKNEISLTDIRKIIKKKAEGKKRMSEIIVKNCELGDKGLVGFTNSTNSVTNHVSLIHDVSEKIAAHTEYNYSSPSHNIDLRRRTVTPEWRNKMSKNDCRSEGIEESALAATLRSHEDTLPLKSPEIEIRDVKKGVLRSNNNFQISLPLMSSSSNEKMQSLHQSPANRIVEKSDENSAPAQRRTRSMSCKINDSLKENIWYDSA